MSANEIFFQNNTFKPNVDNKTNETHPWFAPSQARFLSIDEANALNHDELFDLLITYRTSWNQIDALPLISDEISHTLIPFSIDDHEEINFGPKMLQDVIEPEINNTLGKKKFMVSCDPRHFVAMEFIDFSYDLILPASQSGGINTHFIVFDESRSFWLTWCSEFPFVIISHGKVDSASQLFGKTTEFWQSYFKNNIAKASDLCAPGFLKFLNQTYIPRVDRYPDIPLSSE